MALRKYFSPTGSLSSAISSVVSCGRALILQAIMPLRSNKVWPHETIS